MEEASLPEVCVEEVWGGAEGPASIAELALQQRAVHYPLVQHHCLLASLLHAAMSFSLRLKPLSLFDTKVLCVHLLHFYDYAINFMLRFENILQRMYLKCVCVCVCVIGKECIFQGADFNPASAQRGHGPQSGGSQTGSKPHFHFL